MISIEEAHRRIGACLPHIRPLEEESVPTTEIIGRFTAKEVRARLDSPGFDQSAMDGIAFNGSGDARSLRITGTIAAGDPPATDPLEAGSCMRIMTGAPLPPGADRVQMIEYVHIDEAEQLAVLQSMPEAGSHIRRQGENIRQGDLLIEPGTHCTLATMGALIAQGMRRIQVVRPLRIGIANTGNEIVSHLGPLAKGQVYNTNSHTVARLLKSKLACEVFSLGILPDDPRATVETLARNTDLDLFILSGGVSMGSFDYVPACAQQAGFESIFHKVEMKPGKPLWFGRHKSGTFLFGLPGNPQSALVGAQLFILPLALAIGSGRYRPPATAFLPLAKDVKNHAKFPYFCPIKIRMEDGRTLADPIHTLGSGDLMGFAAMEHLAKIPPKQNLTAGSQIEVLL